MISVASVGVKARFRSEHERVFELEDAADAARAEGLGPAEVDAAVAHAANELDLAIEWFAVLADGRRIETNQERHGQNELGTEFTRDAYSLEGLERVIKWVYWGATPLEDRWVRLMYALEERGLRCSPETLDGLPYTVEIDSG
jgi:hypothetical protein